MGSRRMLPFAFVLPVLLIGGASALAQGPTYRIGRRAWAISRAASRICLPCGCRVGR